MNSSKLFSWFRKTAFAEGVSFLVLLLIAMPLKYLAGWPLGVTIIGGLHGLLFVAFIILVREVRSDLKKSWSWFGRALLASLLPFGTFYMDQREWKKEEIALGGE